MSTTSVVTTATAKFFAATPATDNQRYYSHSATLTPMTVSAASPMQTSLHNSPTNAIDESQSVVRTNASIISDDDEDEDMDITNANAANRKTTPMNAATSTKAGAPAKHSSSSNSRKVRRTLPAAPRSANSLLSYTDLATAELEEFRKLQQQPASAQPITRPFPTACCRLVTQLPGNSNCMDCGKLNPQWATASFGALLCLDCAGHHRSMGVSISTVRSLTMDHWKLSEILQMLEGGNAQLSTFFRRHGLHPGATNFSPSSTLTQHNVVQVRYKTKAGRFYRHQLSQHVQSVPFPYVGRRQQQPNKRPVARSLSPKKSRSDVPQQNSARSRTLLTQTSNVGF